MEKIIIDPVQQSQMTDISQQLPVCDQAGNLLGFFLPPDLYKKLVYKDLDVPYSDAELAHFRQSGEGCSLTDFWLKMGVE